MAMRRNLSSQTIRIDIPPEMLKSAADGKQSMIPTTRLPTTRAAPKKPAESKEAALTPLDSNFQELFQRVYDGALIADLNGKIVDANVRAVAFLRHDRNDLRNMNILELISGADEELLQSLRDNLHKDLFTLIEACYCIRKDNSVFPAEIAVNRLHLSDQDYFCFFIRDISVRRLAEEQLRTEHNAIQNSGNGIAIAMLDAAFQFVNPAMVRLWGYDKTEDLIGRHFRELLSDPTVADNIMKLIKEGKVWSGQSMARRKDNSEFFVQISAAGNRNAEDELVGMVFSFVDISDSKRAAEAERQAERQRVMMESLGTACHHLGQPATVLLASLEVMQKITGSMENKAMQDLVDSGMEAAESLRNMLHELNAMTEYKTRPYLENQGRTAAGDTMILDF